ncbi:hypothetical protein QEZ48_16260 [Aquamicrobium lusatiense]|uniref:hypothetical protein n=1 Tax=Aquamicrobium lusatiense TaxID=89772 RepID=UPI0024549B6E|nr:hypothetical protein [Aquamicrobium lusatiense]MDH4992370.1 hypothetical protein [Aquamicrobium lusatiense]
MQHSAPQPALDYRLNAQSRWISLAPVMAIAVCAAIIFTVLAGSKVWWWSFWILTPPALVAILFAVGLSRMQLRIDDAGLRFRGLGYVVSAPWPQVERVPGSRLSLALREPQVSMSPWIAWMLPIVEALVPWRARQATVSMRMVPLWYFDDGTLDQAVAAHLPAQSAN